MKATVVNSVILDPLKFTIVGDSRANQIAGIHPDMAGNVTVSGVGFNAVDWKSWQPDGSNPDDQTAVENLGTRMDEVALSGAQTHVILPVSIHDAAFTSTAELTGWDPDEPIDTSGYATARTALAGFNVIVVECAPVLGVATGVPLDSGDWQIVNERVDLLNAAVAALYNHTLVPWSEMNGQTFDGIHYFPSSTTDLVFGGDIEVFQKLNALGAGDYCWEAV